MVATVNNSASVITVRSNIAALNDNMGIRVMPSPRPKLIFQKPAFLLKEVEAMR
jgi:hypothetical protein